MKTTAVEPADIARSVWAVPPLARTAEGALNHAANRRLAAHGEAGGISTILWGGNANLYAMTEAEFADLAAAIPDWVGDGTWAIPAVGPDHGKLRAHADILRGTTFPTALLLPYGGPGDPDGNAAAIRSFVDRAGLPATLYLRSARQLRPAEIGAMVAEGVVVAIKYAVETGDLTQDPYLDALLAEVPVGRVVSGIGEIAAIPHLSTFRLCSFTAGAVCIAPRRAMAILRALETGQRGTAEALAREIEPMEALRVAHGPIPVLHAAVTASGLADAGPLGPHFGALDDTVLAEIALAAERLMAGEGALTAAA